MPAGGVHSSAMADRVVWLMAWTLTVALVLASLSVAALMFATVVHPSDRGGDVECRAVDVMLGRADECDGWPTGRAIPTVLVTALVAAVGVPERRRLALSRIAASVVLLISAVVSIRTVADLEFVAYNPTPSLLWGVFSCALVPLVLVVPAYRFDRDDREAAGAEAGSDGSE